MEKERSATPVRLGVIQKKYHNYPIKENVRPKTAFKGFLMIVCIRKRPTSPNNPKPKEKIKIFRTTENKL